MWTGLPRRWPTAHSAAWLVVTTGLPNSASQPAIDAQMLQRLADRHRRGEAGDAGGAFDAAADIGAVIVAEEAGRSLQQKDRLDPSRAEQPRLVVDILLLRWRERRLLAAARHHPGVMRLPFGRQEAAVFKFGRRVGRRDQGAKMP